MIDWLKKRLSPVKDDPGRWTELAEALQQYWEENFDPDAKDLGDLLSVFSTSKEDLKVIIAELGDYFRSDIGVENDWPIQILWRRLELQGKETENLIQMVLRRKFLGLDIRWSPLYAHKTDSYGTNFKKKEEITYQGLDVSDFFLSSRGKISLISPNLTQQGLSFSDFLIAVEEEVERILPTHITYEGTDIVADVMNLYLYFGGVVVEGKVTTLNMVPFVYAAN